MIFNMVGKGGGGSLLISDTLDAAGGTIRTITATKIVKLQTKTITPTSSSQTINPDTGYDGFSQVTVGASGGSNDLIVNITYDSNQGMWVPDKTFSEISAAYLAEKNITAQRDEYYDEVSIDGKFNPLSGYYGYTVYERAYDYGSISVRERSYILNSQNTLSLNNDTTYDIISLQNKTVTPSTSQQNITADSGYTGLGTVTVNAIPTMTLPTSAAASATSGYTSKATIGRSTSAQYINIPPGYNSSGAYYTISATPNGSATGPTSLSGTSATVSTGTNTLTLTKTGVTTTPTVSAGYVSSATASTATVTLTASVTTKAAATITPTTTNQTIAAGTYLTGAQTIAGDADLVASNIISTANIFGVQGSVVLQTVYTGSSAPSSSTGANGDIYIQS